MSARGRVEDVSTLLYLVPFAASGIYAIFLWVRSGIRLILPSSVYLTVTRDPILFALGSAAVYVGLIVELRGTDASARPSKVVSLAGTLQSIAVASLVLVLISAWYANGFTNLSGAATDFIVGRYGVVFPASMVLLSYLISLKFNAAGLRSPSSLAIIALLLVPVSLYEIGRRQTALGLGVALVLIVLGIALLLRRSGASGRQEEK